MPSSYLHFLPALHGDAIIIHCYKGDCTGVIVVDGGPCTNPRLNYFIKAVEEVKSIDLMVLTHHDSDHIVGLLHYFKQYSKDNPFPVKTVWANCSKHIDFETSHELSSSASGSNGLETAIINHNHLEQSHCISATFLF